MNQNKMIYETPTELRPYEKCEALGAEYLTDPELLAVIIKTGTNSLSSVKLAEMLLYPDGERIGLNVLMNSTMEQLQSVKGIGRVKAIQLLCIGELARRMARERAGVRLTMASPGSIADYYMQQLKSLSEEQVYIMLFDVRDMFIKSICISKGTVNCSAVSPREIFITALSHKAAAFVMVHNHPSGDPEPSPEDVMFSKLVQQLGQMMNIPLKDSIVIGDNTFASLQEKGLL